VISRLIGAAFEEAAKLKQSFVGPDEILLVLVREGAETKAASALRASGLTYEATS
jgi:Clp amino terminal domain, pathogenicity island component